MGDRDVKNCRHLTKAVGPLHRSDSGWNVVNDGKVLICQTQARSWRSNNDISPISQSQLGPMSAGADWAFHYMLKTTVRHNIFNHSFYMHASLYVNRWPGADSLCPDPDWRRSRQDFSLNQRAMLIPWGWNWSNSTIPFSRLRTCQECRVRVSIGFLGSGNERQSWKSESKRRKSS